MPARSIPVLRPKLPPAERITPWLSRIDQSGWYSNFGPLEALLRSRLGAMAGLDGERVGLFSSGASALAVALRAQVGKAEGLCLMPSWTHVGTASAATAAGLQPYFLDCDPETWAIEPAAALSHAGRAGVRAVVAVAPFGAALDYAAWERFSRQTSIPVAIDGAAGFDQYVNFGEAVPWGRTPVMVSLHATKVFGVGEGGALLSADAGLIQRAQQLSNFGIWGDQPGEYPFGNHKLSEYAAAVGLAALELWPERRRVLAELQARMKTGLDRINVEPAPGFGGAFVASTCMVRAPGRTAAQLERLFAERNIGVRRWWRDGLHALPDFADHGRDNLANTRRLAQDFLGVPFYPDLEDAALDAVLDVLNHAARSPAKAQG